MAETTELTMPKHLSEIVGTQREMLAHKVALISKFGPTEWQALVARSSAKTKR